MDQRQARNGIAISRYLGCIAIFDDLGKVLRGSLQLIALIIHHTEKPVTPVFIDCYLPAGCPLEQHLRNLPGLLKLTAIEVVET